MINEVFIQIKPWLTWLHLHPYWLSGAVFFIAMIECLAVIGLLVPGTVIMTAIGTLIGSHVISPLLVFIPATLGAILGDVISFFLGYYYRERLREIWPFKFYPRLLQKGESFFYRHGGKGVFVGRFLGPIRPMLPTIAGMLNMKPQRFLIADMISAIFWAPVYMLPGIFLGVASVELPPEVALRLILYVVLFLLLLWGVSWLIKRLLGWLFSVLHSALDRLFMLVKHKAFCRSLYISLEDPSQPNSHAQLMLSVYLIVLLSLFAWMVYSVVTQGVFLTWNHAVFLFFRSFRNTIADNIFILISLLGESKVWIGVFIILTGWFLAIRALRTAAHWFVLGILSFGSVIFLKYLIHSARPWGLTVPLTGYSFPSGHVALSTAFLGFLSVLISISLKKNKKTAYYTRQSKCYAVTVICVLSIAVSRLYLGAHWLTDVLAGMVLSLIIIMLVTLSYRRYFLPDINIKQLSWIFLISLLGMTSLIGIKNFHKMQKDYQIYLPEKVLTLRAWWHENNVGLPVYRVDRTGKPSERFNLQWAGDLENIKHALLLQGWEILPNTTIDLILHRLKQENKKMVMPILLPLHLNNPPVLMMTKNKNVPADSMLILSLWDSKKRLDHVFGMPLWLGSIDYRHIWKTGYFHLHPAKIAYPKLSAMQILEKDIIQDKHYFYKKRSYPDNQQLMLLIPDNQLIFTGNA